MITLANEKKYPALNAIGRSVVFWILFIGVLYVVGSKLQIMPERFERFWYGVLCLASAIVVTWAALKFERRSFGEAGLAWEGGTGVRFIKGLVIGVLLFAVIAAVLILASSQQVVRNPKSIDPSVLLWYAAVLPLAWMEEIAFRAYPFRKINDALGPWVAQVITALAFALYHVAMGWDIKAALLGPGIWGFVFGIATLRSGGIAMATGIHTAVNVMQPLFGMGGDKRAIFILTQTDPTSTSSSTVANNAGIVMQIVLLIAALFLTYRVVNSNKQIPNPKGERNSKKQIPNSKEE